jgi:hypothetical protein
LDDALTTVGAFELSKSMADALFPKPAHLTNLSLSFAGEENEHKPFKPPTRPTRNKQVLLHEIDQKIAQLTCRNDNFCLP